VILLLLIQLTAVVVVVVKFAGDIPQEVAKVKNDACKYVGNAMLRVVDEPDNTKFVSICNKHRRNPVISHRKYIASNIAQSLASLDVKIEGP
jgi:hypothetical protein